MEENSFTDDIFISELITPDPASFDAACMTEGIPGYPHRFTWRGKTYETAALVSVEKTLRDCRSGSKEKYVNKHVYVVTTTCGECMTLYCKRNAAKQNRWTLYTIKRRKNS